MISYLGTSSPVLCKFVSEVGDTAQLHLAASGDPNADEYIQGVVGVSLLLPQGQVKQGLSLTHTGRVTCDCKGKQGN